MATPTSKKEKLRGRAFYESLGSPKMILAPMVDRSEFAWRMLTRSFMDCDAGGVDGDIDGHRNTPQLLAYSPMFHARMFKDSANYREQHFEAQRSPSTSTATTTTTAPENPNPTPYLDGNPTIDRPLIVQFCANDPAELLAAARCVEPFCDAVDLNLGCPQGIARKGHYGAFLQEEPELIYKLINTLHNELSVPVTAKFRIQESKEKTLEYARMILSAGASFLTVHGRRREQKGHNTGLADWEYIRYLRENLPKETVIFANGNILAHGDVERCLEATGADGVMSAEGNLCDPTIFSTPPAVGMEGPGYWRGRDGRGGYRMDFVLRRYMDIIYKYVLEVAPPERKPLFVLDNTTATTTAATTTTNTHPGPSANSAEPALKRPAPHEAEAEPAGTGADDAGPPKKKQKQKRTKDTSPRATSPNLVPMQGHLFQLLRPLVAKHTHIRDCLARARAGNMAAFEEIVTMVDEVVQAGMQEYAARPEMFEEEVKREAATRTVSRETVREYKRPWWVCQPYVRPLPEEALINGAMQLKKRDVVGRRETETGSTCADEAGDCAVSATALPQEKVAG
ncbi:hypothetical protein FQN50_000228 [Emmonsiellopsis sp. PD_5]|nr:hypothetical protein FQN50_000228 [Emmonsiellopsis sp. PD_5]